MAAKTETKAPKWAKALTDRETAFVQEYLVDLSRKHAYIRSSARFGVELTDGSAREGGSQMAQRPHVARAIDDALAMDASGPRQWIVAKLQAIADANLEDYLEMDEKGAYSLKPWKGMPRALTACVKEIRQAPDGTVKLILHDPVRALEILAKVGTIRLTAERLIVEDDDAQLTPDVALARKIAFILQRTARQAGKT